MSKRELLCAWGPGDTAMHPVQATKPFPPGLLFSFTLGDGDDTPKLCHGRSKRGTMRVAGSLIPSPPLPAV